MVDVNMFWYNSFRIIYEAVKMISGIMYKIYFGRSRQEITIVVGIPIWFLRRKKNANWFSYNSEDLFDTSRGY